jgi:hypothetical protein
MAKIKMQHRHFKIGERVFNCNYKESDLCGFCKILLIDGKAEDGIITENTIVTLDMSENGNGEIEELGERIYKIAPRISKKVGTEVCYEHNVFERGHNYQFYVPSRDENYYDFELDALVLLPYL